MENLFKKNPLQDLLSSLNAVISTNESTRIITGHVIYNLAYTYKFQLKTNLLGWRDNSLQRASIGEDSKFIEIKRNFSII